MEIAVIADDLTGANASGVRLAKLGLQTVTKFHWSNHLHYEDNTKATCIDTNSRFLPESEAKKRLRKIINIYKQVGVHDFAKRIDSTMRGNIGAEAEEWVNTFDNKAVVVIVPSFPDSGRTVIGGYLLVHGELLQHTNLSKDPLTPMTKSYVPDLVKAKSSLPVEHIPLKYVEDGIDTIKKSFHLGIRRGTRIFVVDAITNNHIDKIATVMSTSEYMMSPFDPGPLTAAYMKFRLAKRTAKKDKIIVTMGSANELAEQQMEYLKEKRNLSPIYVDPEKLLNPEENAIEINQCINQAQKQLEKDDVILITTINPEHLRLNFRKLKIKLNTSIEKMAERLTVGLATITKEVMIQTPDVKGCFTSGGDMTASLCSVSKANGIQLLKEIQPLVALGKINGGVLDDMKIITKGGSAGKVHTIDHSIQELELHLLNDTQEV